MGRTVKAPKAKNVKRPAQRNLRLEAANKRIENANIRIKAANARIKTAKRKIAKLKRKSSPRKSPQAHRPLHHALSKPPKKAPKKTQRGVVKARGGGPASRPLSRAGGSMAGFFNPFPQAAAFQNPFKLGWNVVKKGGKTVINTRTGRAHKTANTEIQRTEGQVDTFEGGQSGILGMPVGTGQKDITFVKSGDKVVKKIGKKTYKRATGGDAAYSMEPNVFLKETGGEDFTKAGEWWSDYTKLTVAGKVEKGKGQPGYGKGGVGPSEAQKDQPGWYMKPKAGGVLKDSPEAYKVSGPAGGYRVMAGKGKTKTWAGGSTRIEAGAQPGGKWAYEKWFKFLTPGEQEGVKKSFKGSEGLYKSTLDADRGARYGTGKAKPAVVTSKSLTAALNSLPVNTLANALKKMPEQIQKDVGSYGVRNLTDKNKQKLLGFASE